MDLRLNRRNSWKDSRGIFIKFECFLQGIPGAAMGGGGGGKRGGAGGDSGSIIISSSRRFQEISRWTPGMLFSRDSFSRDSFSRSWKDLKWIFRQKMAIIK